MKREEEEREKQIEILKQREKELKSKAEQYKLKQEKVWKEYNDRMEEKKWDLEEKMRKETEKIEKA